MTETTRGFQRLSGAAPRADRLERLSAARLYVCTDARTRQGDLEAFVQGAYTGGADIVQLRDKTLDVDAELAALRLLRGIAAEHGKLFAVNDRADLAALAGADVFHIGQRDLTPAQARSLLGPGVLIGRSTRTPAQAREALEDPDVDYFCTGPVWPTPTKPGRPATGLEFIRTAAGLVAGRPAAAAKPWFAIGGIDAVRLPEVLEAGAERVVVVRSVTDAPDPVAAARRLNDLLPG